MTAKPTLSVIVPWSNRDSLRDTLAGNQRWLTAGEVEIIIVNCGGDAQRLHSFVCDFPRIPAKLIELQGRKFNKSLALNIGLHASSGHTIFVLDADVIVQSDPLAELMPLVDDNTFLTLNRVRESEIDEPWWKFPDDQVAGENHFIQAMTETHSIEFRWADGTVTRINAYRANICDESRAGPGLVMVKREHLLRIEGYNSELELWGWEDNDVDVRLRRVLSLKHRDFGQAVHLTHGDELRNLDGLDHRRSDFENLARVCKRYSRGNFMGTYSADIATWWPRARHLGRQRASES
jgi:glycosyltransferase involved in cell wall biosynthesis